MLEVANRSSRALDRDALRRRVYLRIGQRQLRPDPAAASTSASLLRGGPVESGGQRTGKLRFELRRADVEALVREDGEVELAVVPASEVNADRPRRLGVVRLTAPTDPVRPLLQESASSDRSSPGSAANSPDSATGSPDDAASPPASSPPSPSGPTNPE